MLWWDALDTSINVVMHLPSLPIRPTNPLGIDALDACYIQSTLYKC
jgi:hypothetical protein